MNNESNIHKNVCCVECILVFFFKTLNLIEIRISFQALCGSICMNFFQIWNRSMIYFAKMCRGKKCWKFNINFGYFRASDSHTRITRRWFISDFNYFSIVHERPFTPFTQYTHAKPGDIHFIIQIWIWKTPLTSAVVRRTKKSINLHIKNDFLFAYQPER